MLDGLTFALTTRRGRRCAGANLFWSILAAALSWTLCHTAFPAEAGTGVEEAEAERSRLFEQGLRLANLRPSDLAFGLLPDLEDSLRLARVDEVLEEGLRVDTWAERLAGELESCSRLQELVHRLRHELRRSGEAGWRPVEQRLGRHGARSFSRWLELLKELGRTRFRPAADLDSLERDLLELLREEEGLEHLDVFTLDSLERASRRQLEGRVERLSRAVLPDPGQLERVLGDIDRLFLDLPFFKAAALGRETWEHPLYGSVHYADELVVVGAEGENVYPGETPPLLIDLGGADRYTGPAARSRGTLSLVLDLGGDDVYSCEAEPGIASSVGGLSVLIDLAGDDRYRASSFALGAALGGTALLIDHEGEDLYEGDTFCLGAGSLGLGVLVDGAGRDLYSCSLYGQGFGHLAGLGLLQDNGGDDSSSCGRATWTSSAITIIILRWARVLDSASDPISAAGSVSCWTLGATISTPATSTARAAPTGTPWEPWWIAAATTATRPGSTPRVRASTSPGPSCWTARGTTSISVAA